MVTRVTNKGIQGITPNVRDAYAVKFADGEAYTTGNIFTVTNVGTATVAPTLYPNPGTAALPGRSCLGVTYNAAITDGLQGCRPGASIIPQLPSPSPYNLNPFVIKFAVASSIMASAEFFFGLAVVTTTEIATPTTDYVGIIKLVGDAQFSLTSRKATGTAQKTALPMLALANATWYDFTLILNRDPVTAGMAVADVYWDINEYPETGYANHVTIPIASQFPDTVLTSPTWATRVGFASAVSYLDYFVWQQGN
jgi:hypothetical protein